MTQQEPLPTATPAEVQRPRPGSRADRMRKPLAKDALKQLAEQHGVCVRPLALRRTDTTTGLTEVVEVPCGATLAAKCRPCAERGRRLRIQQIREGWHLTDEPTIRPDKPGEDVLALVRVRAHLEFEREAIQYQPMTPDERAAQVAEIDAAIAELDEALGETSLRGHLTPKDRDERPRRKRSTRRRQDTPDLPRLPVDPRTVGRAYPGRAGKTYRPSMLITLTLGSHGPVHSHLRRGAYVAPCECGQRHGPHDDVLGTPVDPAGYDYRRAALDAIHFARVLDRWWQNVRRAAGWNVQYAGAVELQRRLAPHAHFAIRGTLPRRLLKQIAAATYHQVWWPPFDHLAYPVDKPPVWNVDRQAYVDPKTRQPLPTWGEALDALEEPDSRPAYVARLGRIDARGIEQGTRDAERSIRYVTKYVTKDLTDQAKPRSDAQKAHFDRLHAELSILPCSPTCANWLLYGVQPDGVKAGLTPGRCTGKVHQRSTLGFTGRRVLVSRQWSGKTLADHRADNRAWVRAILAGGMADTEEHDQAADDDADGSKRYQFELARPEDPDVPPLEHRLLRAISARIRWRTDLDTARLRTATATPATAAPLTPAA
uniref:Replication initiation protein n=2 Tax=Micromonospora TaxID=1873 RepID=A0A7D6CE89_9ACTN|nr:replication initiator [Micromonospora sp. ATCC 39149]QLJ99129.1 replication initiation protein [Micromonospora carbonacea]